MYKYVLDIWRTAGHIKSYFVFYNEKNAKNITEFLQRKKNVNGNDGENILKTFLLSSPNRCKIKGFYVYRVEKKCF